MGNAIVVEARICFGLRGPVGGWRTFGWDCRLPCKFEDSATLIQAPSRGKRARPRPIDTLPQPMFGEWLSLVEHLVRDQGVGGSNPLSPTIKSHRIIELENSPFRAESELGSIWVQ